jgi:hypothetical protein
MCELRGKGGTCWEVWAWGGGCVEGSSMPFTIDCVHVRGVYMCSL